MEVNPNSQQPTGSNVASNGLGNVQRPGEYLRQVRVSKILDISDVAAELKMPVKTLQALEQDEYKSLPEATFIKGYYRSYAKYLNVDATAIIQRFDEIYQNDTGLLPNHALNNSPIKIMGKLPGSNRDRNKKWFKRIFIALIVIAAIWALIAGIQKWTSNKNVDAEVKPQESDVEVLNLNNSTSTSGDQMVLNFSHPTSVHIVDSTGKVLATGRQSSTLNLSGSSPFEIRLDDATAVSLSLNNEQISLSPYTVNGKAEFRLSR
ncbi:helix-turn-helix domain-containing protein [Acinetobacter rongchengensis]|uniref:Helix-turn-helix domain-containing protein n=1 Tax=Acinetobacter rongchengensis TaxID=2419601 RepID=A0A3A8F156_9GAMM|nr:helix-turn-helix domain-containing protein [Acinetobacter rongchengensis]RKG39516.1 helix-turn-helix domain-containing protein [Acinetobacter rongchengensis]